MHGDVVFRCEKGYHVENDFSYIEEISFCSRHDCNVL